MNKLIVISGFARGGTNMLWNIIQSHPRIESPPTEVNKLSIDDVLAQHSQSDAVCLKATDYGINKIEDIAKYAVNIPLFIIFLIRNGYAICDGYVRRGYKSSRAGKIYANVGKKMRQIHETMDNVCVVRFEDMVSDPFNLAESLFKFIGMPQTVDRLRLKSKKIVTQDGRHLAPYGDQGQKYWFTRDTIGEIIDPNIDDIQSSRLSGDDLETFEKYATEMLVEWGYKK